MLKDKFFNLLLIIIIIIIYVVIIIIIVIIIISVFPLTFCSIHALSRVHSSNLVNIWWTNSSLGYGQLLLY